MSFWGELSRRSVFKVAAAYCVIAWLLVQVASIVLPAFDLPRWLMQAVLLLAALGFPVSVIFAWIYDLTPAGIRRASEAEDVSAHSEITKTKLAVAVAALVVLTGAFLMLVQNLRLSSATQSDPNSVAVLPFENLGRDSADDYIADGVADELLNVLSRLSELKVASRLSSFYFKGKDVDAKTIASTLLVRHVLGGTVRRDGQRIRITAELVEANSGFRVWAHTYDGGVDAILEIQGQIAEAVTTAIVQILSPESRQRLDSHPTQNLQAYDYYLRGLDYLRMPADTATLASAKGLLDRALDLDPSFAEAHAALCRARLESYAFTLDTEEFARAESSCNLALELDAGLWEVHVALGTLYRYAGEFERGIEALELAVAQRADSPLPYLELGNIYWAQNRNELAERTFRRAIEIEPASWQAHNTFSNFLFEQGRYEESLESSKTVIELIPDSGVGYDNIGLTYWILGEPALAENAWRHSLEIAPSRWAYMNLGEMYHYESRFADAADAQRKAIAIDPNDAVEWGRLADAYRLQGEARQAAEAYAEAARLAEARLSVNPNDSETNGWLGVFRAHLGQSEAAKESVAKMLALDPDDSYSRYLAGLVYLRLGDMESAYAALEQAVALGITPLLIRQDPDLAPLRGMPRFDALLGRLAD